MIKDKEIHGVDISKDVFDVFDHKGVHYQYPNTLKGFRDYFRCLNSNSLVISHHNKKMSVVTLKAG